MSPTADEWIDKCGITYKMEYYSAIKSNDILPFATALMDLEGIVINE